MNAFWTGFRLGTAQAWRLVGLPAAGAFAVLAVMRGSVVPLAAALLCVGGWVLGRMIPLD